MLDRFLTITHKLRSLLNSFFLHAGNPFGQLDGCRYASRSAPPANSRTRGRGRRLLFALRWSFGTVDDAMGALSLGRLRRKESCNTGTAFPSLSLDGRLVLSDQRAASRPLKEDQTLDLVRPASFKRLKPVSSDLFK